MKSNRAGVSRHREMLESLRKIRDAMRSPYDPNPRRRRDVVRFLAQRRSRSHEEWHREFAVERGIPLSFVAWYRDTCSKYFGYDLSAAVPDDKLVEDLGFGDATWGDADWDILEQYEAEFDGKRPPLENVTTFGHFLEALWTQARKDG